jgi:small-conductance mechanosensitive channel
MNVQQEINLALLKKFKEVGIEIAYPTQKIFTVPV